MYALPDKALQNEGYKHEKIQKIIENPKYFFHQLRAEFSINELIEFYDDVYTVRDKQSIINEIREFAEKKCDMYQVLKAIDDEEVYIEFGSSISPCLIKSIENNDYTYMILPIRLKEE